MAFEWTSRKSNDSLATLYETNITFNKTASGYLEKAYRVLLGLDASSMRIAVKPITKQEYERGTIPEEKRHKISLRPSYARISNKRFMQEISQLINIDFKDNTAVKVRTEWSAQDKALIIDLNHLKEPAYE